jgi:TonB-dependent starch-binding outer membrane protein SusC
MKNTTYINSLGEDKKGSASRKWMLSLLFLLCSSVAVLAQQVQVSGTIIDENGGAVPGVTVVEKGTSNGTNSDNDGKYTLNVSGSSATLVFSFIGYKTQEVPVNNQTSINISLAPDITALQEVLVTGYSSERKQDIVSAVSVVSKAYTVAIPVSNVEQALQGRVAGVQVTTSGQPGSQSQVRIRGYGSLTSNIPLYVVDGVPTYDVSNINPYDIETTTVLKDAGAASIYGSRAAAGVIVYTTKHGKNDGKTRVDFDMSTGLNFPGKGISVLNPQDQANAVYTALRNGGANSGGQPYGSDLSKPQLPDYVNVGVQQSDGSWKPQQVFNSGPNATPGAAALVTAATNAYNVDASKGPIVQVVSANKSGTDWYKAMTRVAPVARYSLGMSGGTDRAHYYLNMTYYNQQGLAQNQYLKRYNVRMNSEFKPAKNVRIGENILLTYKDNPLLNNTSQAAQVENVLNFAYRMPTIIPVHDNMGNWAGTAAPGFNNPANPAAALSRLNRNYNQTTTQQIFGNVYAEVDPIPHLTLRTSFGGSYNTYYYMNFAPLTYENAENTSSNTLNQQMAWQTNWISTNTARYANKFGDHSITAIVGYEAVKQPASSQFISGFGLNPFSTDPNFISLTNTNSSGRQLGGGVTSQVSALASLFGRLDYNYQDKYYLSATMRRDASSVFGPSQRTGYFPAFSGAWRISSESFMQGTSSWLNDLKIRGGWGVMGNQAINPTNQYTLYQGSPTFGYDINGTNNSVSPGLVPQQVGNPAGHWEKNVTSNIGLDGTFLNGTFDVVLEFWQKNTSGLLYAPQVPASAGVYQSNPVVNIASMVNKGIDIQLIKRIKIDNDWSLVLDGNIAPLQNKITALAPGITYFDAGTFRNLTFIRNSIGHSISSFFGYQMDGYFRNAADVSKSAAQDGAAPGRFKFRDVNGDGKITPDDRIYMGSPVPKFTYGFNLTVKYKNWSLDAFLYGKEGNKIVNFSKWYNDFYQSFSGAALSSSVLNAWTPEHPDGAKTPILETNSNFSTNSTANSWYVENGGYLRCKNLQLNYNIPGSMLSKYNINRLRVYAQAVNLFTITKYTGKDPEVASSVDTTLGVDVGNYPATRIWSLGLNLGF